MDCLTSNVYDRGRLYDAASTIMQQKLSQIQGVGQVYRRRRLASCSPYRDQSHAAECLWVRTSRRPQHAESAECESTQRTDIGRDITADILANDQLLKAEYYRSLIVGYHKGAAIKLSDIAEVRDSVENIRAAGFSTANHASRCSVFRQPGANIIDTVDRIRQALPSLKASIPAGIISPSIVSPTTNISFGRQCAMSSRPC